MLEIDSFWEDIYILYISGQIIATSHDPTPNGRLVREILLFQGHLGWWNMIIWPDICIVMNLVKFPVLCYLDLFLLVMFYGLRSHGMNIIIKPPFGISYFWVPFSKSACSGRKSKVGLLEGKHTIVVDPMVSCGGMTHYSYLTPGSFRDFMEITPKTLGIWSIANDKYLEPKNFKKKLTLRT